MLACPLHQPPDCLLTSESHGTEAIKKGVSGCQRIGFQLLQSSASHRATRHQQIIKRHQSNYSQLVHSSSVILARCSTMSSKWAAASMVVIVSLTTALCLPSPALATHPARRAAPSMVGQAAAPHPPVKPQVPSDHLTRPVVVPAVPGSAGVEAMPGQVPGKRPALVRPGAEGENNAGTTTTTTTTLDPLTAFCQEACRAGVGGPECNCPGHPVGRRHAPPLYP